MSSRYRTLVKAGPIVLAIVLAILLATALPGRANAAADNAWADVKARGTLRCGAATAPPYVVKDVRSGHYTGYFSVLCERFAKRLGVKPVFVDTSWDNLVAGVQSRRWDLALALNETPQRKKAVTFSDAVSQYKVSLLYRAGNTRLPAALDAHTSVAALDHDDITVAVMAGTVQDKAVSKAFEQARIMRLPSMNEVRLSVISGRADFMADANASNRMFAYAHPAWARTVVPEPPLAEQGVGFAMARSRPAADVNALNRFIAQQRRSGQIHALIEQASKQVAETRDR